MFDRILTLAATPTEDSFRTLLALAEEVDLTEAQWTALEHALAAWPPDVPRRAPTPWLDDHGARGPRVVVADLRSWRLCNTLALGGALGSSDVEAVVGARDATHVEELHLSSNALPDELLAQVIAAPQHRSVRAVSIVNNRVGPACARALASSFPRLQALTMGWTGLGDDGLARVLDAVWLASLVRLVVYDSSLTARGAARLAGTALPSLQVLSVTDPIGSAGALALARAPGLGALTDLRLSGCAVDDAGATELATIPTLARLERLDLRRNELSERGIAALAASPRLRGVAVELPAAVTPPAPTAAATAASADLAAAVRDALASASKYLDDPSVGARDYAPWLAVLAPHHAHPVVSEVLVACVAHGKVSSLLFGSPLPDAWLQAAREHADADVDGALLATLVRRGYPPALDEARRTDDPRLVLTMLGADVPGAVEVAGRVLRARTSFGGADERAIIKAAATLVSPTELFDLAAPWIASGQEVSALLASIGAAATLDPRWATVAIEQLRVEAASERDHGETAPILARCPFTPECRDYALANMPLPASLFEVWATQPELVDALLAPAPARTSPAPWLDAVGVVVTRADLTGSQVEALRARLPEVVAALTEPSEVWALELVIDGLSDLGKRWPWSDWIEAAVPRILEGPHGPAVIERLRGLVAS